MPVVEPEKTEHYCGDYVEEHAKCESCDDIVCEGDVLSHGNDIYCQDCYADRFTACTRCGHDFDTREMSEYEDDLYCDHCYDIVYEDNEESECGIPERMYSPDNLPEFQSKDGGEIITSQRMFSAEIECYYPNSDDIQRVARELPRAFGVSYDGSLNSNGVEFQTPKLRGKNGEEAIKLISKLLNDNDFRTDRSTGLHIHLDGKGMIPKTRTKHRPEAIMQAMTFYIAFEDVMLSFLPPSRRANSYCRMLRNSYHMREIEDAISLEALEKIWYRETKRINLKRCKSNKYNETRYAGINFHSLLKDGHIEVRYHSGTMSATKILEWTNLHQTILDKACERYSNLSNMARRASTMPSLKEKTALLFEALQLPVRAQSYFLTRQGYFNSTEENHTEAVSLSEVCAE